MTEHAILSASSDHRWLTCPPLPRLERFFEKKTSEVAHEGTVTHSLAEHKLHKLIGQKTWKPKSKLIDADMEQHTDDYVSYICELLQTIKQTTTDPIVLIEQRLDFSNYVL